MKEVDIGLGGMEQDSAAGGVEMAPLSLASPESPGRARLKPPLDVVAAIIWRRRRREVLIAQRRWSDSLGGYWEFPGGKVERGESEAEALRRELKEELGIDVQVGRRVHETSHRYPTRLIRLRFFQAWIVRGTPKPKEVADVRWVKVNRLGRYKFPPADKDLIEMMMRRSLDVGVAAESESDGAPA